MRIICPNCDAQYEVPDEVIPPEGRDVQCSDCGTTWMHEPPDHPGTAWAETEAASEPAADVPQDAVEDDAETAEEPPDPGPRRRELDPAVAGILREEARREADARARDTQPESLETQPDLGLPEGEAAGTQQAREARERRSKGRDATRDATGNRDDPASDGQAQGTGPEPAADTGAAADTAAGPAATPTGSRKELLPDIEEINSTLRSSGERDAGEDLDTYESGRTRGRRGFQRGFLFAVLVFMIAALAYQFAPEIAQAVPQADPWISAYVTWIDDLRMMTDQQVRNLLTWLDNLSTPDI